LIYVFRDRVVFFGGELEAILRPCPLILVELAAPGGVFKIEGNMMLHGIVNPERSAICDELQF
jgi:hypothetical protein